MSYLETILFILPAVIVISIPLLWWLHDIRKYPNIHRVGRKEKYHILEETPMVWHKISSKILLPIWAFYNILFSITFIINLTEAESNKIITSVSLLFTVILSALSIFSYVRIKRMEWSGVIGLISIYAINFAYQIAIYVIEFLEYQDYSLVQSKPSIAYVLVSIVVYLYYRKRRPLFTPYIEEIPNNREDMVMQDSQSDSNNIIFEEDIHEEPVEDNQYDHQEEKRVYGPLDPPDAKDQKKSHIVLSVICILVCLLIGSSGWVAAYIEKQQVSELQSDIETLKSENQKMKIDNTSLKARNADLKIELETKKNVIDLMLPAAYMTEKQIGFIVHGSKYYHQFKCSVYQAEDEFWAHNIEYCKYLGYEECPLCWNDDASYTPNNKLHLVPKS